jgi:hypothetical protein
MTDQPSSSTYEVQEVVRFLRPEDRYWEGKYSRNNNLYGITIIFALDYNTRQVGAQWSVCREENFNKKIGKSIAESKPVFYFDMPDVRTPLVTALLKALSDLTGLYARQDYPYEVIESLFLKASRKLGSGVETVEGISVGSVVVVVAQKPHYSAWRDACVKGSHGIVQFVAEDYVNVLLDGWDFAQTCHISDVEVVTCPR